MLRIPLADLASNLDKPPWPHYSQRLGYIVRPTFTINMLKVITVRICVLAQLDKLFAGLG